jgi:hypothetical protein
MPLRLMKNTLPDQFLQRFRLLAKHRYYVNLCIVAKTRANLAITSQPDPVAGAAKAMTHGAYKTHKPLMPRHSIVPCRLPQRQLLYRL